MPDHLPNSLEGGEDAVAALPGLGADDEALRLIAELSRRHMSFTVVCGLLLFLVACMSLWLSMFAIDNIASLPAGLRTPLAVMGGVATVIAFLKLILRPVILRQSPERISILLERKLGIKNNLIINSCQFGLRPPPSTEAPFAELTIASSERLLRGASAVDADDWRRFAWIILAFLSLAGVWTCYAVAYPAHVANAFVRFAVPFRDTPPLDAFAVEVEPFGEVFVLEGGDMAVRVHLKPVDPPHRSVSPRPESMPTPFISWAPGIDANPTPDDTRGRLEMSAARPGSGDFVQSFKNLRSSFAFRVFAGSSYSQRVRVKVVSAPKIASSYFSVEPPAYTGERIDTRPGPPAPLSCIEGSMILMGVEFEAPAAGAYLACASDAVPLSGTGRTWRTDAFSPKPGTYTLDALEEKTRQRVSVASADVKLTPDAQPVVEFDTDERNLLVNQFSTLVLALTASDDFGVKSVSIRMRPGSAADSVEPLVLKAWSYLGPPGNRGPFKESCAIEIDSIRFVPGEAYLVDAACEDFCPSHKPAFSKPVIVRIRSLDDLRVGGEARLLKAFDALKRTAAQQTKSNAATGNVRANVADILEKKSWEGSRIMMRDLQGKAKTLGEEARTLFKDIPDAKPYADRVDTLAGGEMRLAVEQLERMKTSAVERIAVDLQSVEERQKYILKELLTLLGEIADDAKEKAKNVGAAGDESLQDAVEEARRTAEELKDDLKDFLKAEKRVVELSKSLLDVKMDDLTEGERDILGSLAREQGEWAKLFEEKLTDFSKLPYQDFADSSLVKELNEVFQEIKLAEKSLYEKKIELAVPAEQSGVENAAELLHNLERWLPDTPDYIKWNMEEPPAPTDAPLAELPTELEDIVGDLLDSEEAMNDDVEDVSSSWMDSLDKGAGWDAGDGPISNMSARGVTGNLLPNQNEIGGGQGGARGGKRHGESGEESAEGKGGRQTPTRLSPEPFEQGNVKDKSTEAPGGATGGGKLAGFSQEGLVGPAPPPSAGKGPRLADRQSVIRQKAEALALKMKARGTHSGDLESSIAEMKSFEKAAAANDGLGIRRAYSKVLDRLSDARSVTRGAAINRREGVKLPEKLRDEVMEGLRDGVPKG